MRDERLKDGSKTKQDMEITCYACGCGTINTLGGKTKGAVSKSYLPCGDTGVRCSCDELPEKRNKGGLMEGGSQGLLSFTGHASRQNERRRFSR